MTSKSIYPFFVVLLATLPSLKSYSQKALADSVITKDLLQHYVQALAHDSMQGRYTGTVGCEKAAALIAGEMKALGLLPLSKNKGAYDYPYYLAEGTDTSMAANIVGVVPGKISDKYILFSAHYDHIGDSNQQGSPLRLSSSPKDKIYNGANDNASGVAALLALASYFKFLQNNSYTLLFVAFSGEENGLLGSNVFVESFVKLKNIKQVINLDMLGRFSANSPKPIVTEGIYSYNFTKKLNRNLRQVDPTAPKAFFRVDNNLLENYFMRSDNYSFAQKGVPANTIMSTNILDDHYHSPSDEWETLDYEAMMNLVKGIALACTPMVQSKN